ncbi:hypothetical protein [Rhizobium sp. C4]|uniref:hypothetical protein n=1 Tax=Rhizobium sp. C4 TaxID=1349800 RepID=UPI001E5D0DE7|nr:hypothetical protein [Rhizobium sp. C4]MCD2172819.1 hypothetical protein [Rhizobium sp. C4]
MTSQNVNQEVIDAYYEYTHLTLDRSKFADKLREMAKTEAKLRSFQLERDWASLRTDAEAKRPQ